ncbi:MAG: phosphoethanolamine transferase [Cardiobacteriaceae bacterium]|nr:phosphoethanolamine transferase [Cardiobacteriaceae bacterium]
MILTSWLACYATGYAFQLDEAFSTVVIATFGTPLCFLVSALFSKKVARWWFACFLIVTTLYFPVGWMYGAPNFKIVGGALEADGLEIREFLLFVPKYVWALQSAYGIFAWVAWHKVQPLWDKVEQLQKRYRVYMVLVLLMVLVFPWLRVILVVDKWLDIHDYQAPFPIHAVGFYLDLASAPYIYFQKKSALMEQANLPSTWHIQSINPRYKNYVLIIGESARADYMHAYGFPLENTPFLSQSKALLIDGYLSTAEFTMASLPKTLSLRNSNLDEVEKIFVGDRLNHNNIISLAKQAGFETAWLSNQGMLGLFANETSSYAQRADYVYFTQRGDYQNSRFLGDTLLLSPFRKLFLTQTHAPRLIVFHIMGSHHDFCKRLENPTPFEFKSEKISCYVGTIKQTDDLMRDIVQILEEQGESWSLVYFSDHGLKHIGLETSEASLQHGGDTYESFYVPLVKLSSDDIEKRILKTTRSAFYFLTGFADWLGLEVEELKRPNYDFWGKQEDIPASDNNLEQILHLPKDPY